VPGAGARDAAATRLATVASEGIAAGGAAGGARVLLVACAEVADDVPAALRRCFTHELALDAPDEPHRLSLLRGALAARRADGAALAAAAAQAGGLLPRDLRAVAADAAAAAVRPLLPWRARGAAGPPPAGAAGAGAGAAPSGGALVVGKAELDAALEAARERTSAAIGAPQVLRCAAGGLRRACPMAGRADVPSSAPVCLAHAPCAAGRTRSRSAQRSASSQSGAGWGPLPGRRAERARRARRAGAGRALGGRGRPGGGQGGHPGDGGAAAAPPAPLRVRPAPALGRAAVRAARRGPGCRGSALVVHAPLSMQPVAATDLLRPFRGCGRRG